jgi:hypothetical protein
MVEFGIEQAVHIAEETPHGLQTLRLVLVGKLRGIYVSGANLADMPGVDVPNFNMDRYIGWRKRRLCWASQFTGVRPGPYLRFGPRRCTGHNVWDICGCARRNCSRALMDSGVGG